MKLLRLLVTVAAVLLIWLKLLPQWAATPEMRSALERHEQAGINGGAIYYSENPVALESVASIQEVCDENPWIFWRMERPFRSNME